MILYCVICGKKVSRNLTKVRRNKSKSVVCSPKCRAKWRYLIGVDR